MMMMSVRWWDGDDDAFSIAHSHNQFVCRYWLQLKQKSHKDEYSCNWFLSSGPWIVVYWHVVCGPRPKDSERSLCPIKAGQGKESKLGTSLFVATTFLIDIKTDSSTYLGTHRHNPGLSLLLLLNPFGNWGILQLLAKCLAQVQQIQLLILWWLQRLPYKQSPKSFQDSRQYFLFLTRVYYFVRSLPYPSSSWTAAGSFLGVPPHHEELFRPFR